MIYVMEMIDASSILTVGYLSFSTSMLSGQTGEH